MDYVLDVTTKPAEKDVVLARIELRGKSTGEYIVAHEVASEGKLRKRVKTDRFIEAGPDEMFWPVLSKNGMKRGYLSGPTRCGKSHLCGKMLADSPLPILMFSRLEEDPSIDDQCKVERIPLDSLVEHPLDLEDIRDRVLVFDDHCVAAKPIAKKATELLDKALAAGRHFGLDYILRTSHQGFDGLSTRNSLLHSNFAVFFPSTGGRAHAKRYLVDRMGISSGDANKLLKTTSRWLLAFCDAPNAVVMEKHVELLG